MKSNTLKLLIADDEPWIFQNLKNMIPWKEMSIELLPPAGNGEEAMALIDAGKPDILITDINMPHMDGNELIRKARERLPRLQIIVISGYDDFEYVREALVHGAIDYLLKPITQNSLIGVVRKAVSLIGRESRDEKEKAETREKLLRASSIITDGEYSRLLNKTPDSEASHLLSRLDLEFSMFRFILFRFIDISQNTRDYGSEPWSVHYEIKKEIEKSLGDSKSVLFNNIYSRSDFILLTDLGERALSRLEENLPSRLMRRYNSRLRLYSSGPRFSFQTLSGIYGEARRSLSRSRFSSEKILLVGEHTSLPDIRKRISAEQERNLAFAINKGGGELIRSILFQNVGMTEAHLADWLILEISQTLELVSGLLMYHFQTDRTSILSLENYVYLMESAVNGERMGELISLLEQMLDDLFPLSSHLARTSSMDNRVKDVQDYIEKYYFRDISLSTLSETFSVDRSYLCRTYKNLTGENLMVSIARKRIEKAQEYIRQSVCSRGKESREELNLTEISDLVGYEEYSYFNRVFRKITGLSPSEYRKSMRGK